jgi:hypothetical protein
LKCPRQYGLPTVHRAANDVGSFGVGRTLPVGRIAYGMNGPFAAA